RYLVNYGFTLANNELNNQACIYINLPDGLSSKKLQIIGPCTSYDDGYSNVQHALQNNWIELKNKIRFQIKCPSKKLTGFPPSGRLPIEWSTFICIRLLRVLLATDEEMCMIKNADHQLFSDIPALSVRNELAVMKHLN